MVQNRVQLWAFVITVLCLRIALNNRGFVITLILDLNITRWRKATFARGR